MNKVSWSCEFKFENGVGRFCALLSSLHAGIAYILLLQEFAILAVAARGVPVEGMVFLAEVVRGRKSGSRGDFLDCESLFAKQPFRR